jgi:hypothetical protein
MQLTQQAHLVQSQGTQQSHQASIELSATAVQILSSNIYTDKALAIVRELSCNAYDAHQLIGQTAPFKVTLPTYFEPTLTISDSGPGLSQDDIFYLYMTYFGSNKRDTNTLIGGFGLGSKTPLSYTDMFTVVSHHQHVAKTYSIYRNAAGIPEVALLGEAPTDHHGLEVSLAVRPGDVSRFDDAACRALQYFPVGSYQVINGEVEPIEYTFKSETLGIPKRRFFSSAEGTNVIMGNVAYAVDYSALSLTSEQAPYNKTIDLFFDIGDLAVQASRERLSYDPQTIARLEERLLTVNDQLLGDLESSIENLEYPFQWYWNATSTLPRSVFGAARRKLILEGHTQITEPNWLYQYEFCKAALPHTAKARLRTTSFQPLSIDLSNYAIASPSQSPVFILVSSTNAIRRILTQNPELTESANTPIFAIGPVDRVSEFKAFFGPSVVTAKDLVSTAPRKAQQRLPGTFVVMRPGYPRKTHSERFEDITQIDASTSLLVHTRKGKPVSSMLEALTRSSLDSVIGITEKLLIYVPESASKATKRGLAHIPKVDTYIWEMFDGILDLPTVKQRAAKYLPYQGIRGPSIRWERPPSFKCPVYDSFSRLIRAHELRLQRLAPILALYQALCPERIPLKAQRPYLHSMHSITLKSRYPLVDEVYSSSQLTSDRVALYCNLMHAHHNQQRKQP